MRFYIVDDDSVMIDVLEDVILQKELGEIVGTETDPSIAADDIIRMRPDIVLADFMMSKMDGIKLVTTIREKDPGINFVMISKVTDKAIIHKAYDAGVEFFISKPISLLELERVLNNVADRIRMRSMMDNIRSMFDNAHLIQPVYRGETGSRTASPGAMNDNNYDILLGEIGILGESGARDIRTICRMTAENGGVYDKKILQLAAEGSGDNIKNVEQRVRRAIRKGLANCANAGLEDISGEKFSVYANYVFDYTTLREEMNFITGRSNAGGRISIARFIEGMILYDNNSR